MTTDLNIRDKLKKTLEDSRAPAFIEPGITNAVPSTPQGRESVSARLDNDIQNIQGSLTEGMGEQLDEESQNNLLKLRERLKTKNKGKILIDQSNIDPKEFIAEQVGGDFQEGGLKGFGTRADLALSDTFDEKRAKFLSKFPEGDMVIVDRAPKVQGINNRGRGGKSILVKRNGDEQYYEMDPSEFEIADIADLLGSAPELAGEAAALIRTRGTGLITQVMATALGNAVGEAGEEIIEKLRGFQKETFGEVSKRIGGESAMVAAGTAMGGPVSGPIRSFDKGVVGLKGRKDKSEIIQKFAEKQGLPNLRLDEVSTNPIIQRLGSQAEAIIPSLGDDVKRKNEALIKTLLNLRDADAKKFVRGELKDIHEESISQMQKALPNIEGDLLSAGDAVQKGLAEYEQLSRAVVDTMYERARKKGDVEFDLAPALSIADDLESGIKFKGVNDKDFNVEKLHPSVKKAITALREIDFNAPVEIINGRSYGPVERLRSVVQYLDDVKAFGSNPLSMEKDVSARVAGRQANKLFDSLRYVLDNPIAEDEGVMAAYRAASEQASKRFKTMQDTLTKQVLSTDEGRRSFEIAGNLAAPGRNVDDLKFVQDVLTRHDPSGKRLGEFRNGVIGNMLDKSNLQNLKQTLSQYNEEQRKILFPDKVWEQLSGLANQVERTKLLDIENVLNKQSKAASAIGEIIDTENTGAMKRLLEFMPKDPNDLRRKSMRAAVIDDILVDSIKLDPKNPGVRILDEKALKRKLENMKENGAIKILTSDDLNTLKNARLYKSFITGNSDVGTSLQAAETAAQFREIFSPAGGGLKSLITIAEAYGTSRILMNKKFQDMVVGKGSKKARNAADMINATAAIMATLNEDIQGYTEADKVLNNQK